MKKIVLVLLVIFMFTGCGDDLTYEVTSYSDYSSNISYLVGSKRDKRLTFFDVNEYKMIRSIPNNLSDSNGGLAGRVQFAQSHTIDPNNNEKRREPSLVPNRTALLLFTPQEHIGLLKELKVTVKKETHTKEFTMLPPLYMPKSDYAGDGSRPDVTYSKRSYNVQIPYYFIGPEMNLDFKATTLDGRILKGTLTGKDIEFGAPIESVFLFIRLGLLTDAPDKVPYDFYMINRPANAIAEYFQTIPQAQMANGFYEARKLPKVIISNGTIYTESNPSPYPNPSDHSGDMREDVAKAQVSVGINFANKGVASSPLNQNHNINHDMFYFTVHHTRGKYVSGIQEHGLSGGNGIGTLYKSATNEFSHEVDHGYGRGHHPYKDEGSDGSVHGYRTGWGYDAYKNRMRANIDWKNKNVEDYMFYQHYISTFQKTYRWNNDSMNGGGSDSAISRYTHSTARTTRDTQKNISGRYFLDNKLTTIDGKQVYAYNKWDPYARKVVQVKESFPYKNMYLGTQNVDILLNDKKLTIAPTEFPKEANKQQEFLTKKVKSAFGNEWRVTNFVKNSDGTYDFYVKTEFAEKRPLPSQKGVPVITILGGYDPSNPEKTVLYEYFRGNYGNIFESLFLDTKPASVDTYLQITYYENNGVTKPTQYVELANTRYEKNIINKLHVNIPESDKPQTITLFVKGQEKGKTTINRTVYDTPMPKAVVVGKENDYKDVITADVNGLNSALEKQDVKSYIVTPKEKEIILILDYHNKINELKGNALEIAKNVIDKNRKVERVNQHIEDNYNALESKDITAISNLEKLMADNGLGKVEYNFNHAELNGFCMEVYGMEEGKKYVRTMECNKHENQRWAIDNQGRIHSALFPEYCLDSAKVDELRLCSDSNTQRWQEKPVDNTVVLYENVNHKKCIDSNTRLNNHHIILYNCSTSNQNQKFKRKIDKDSNVYLGLLDGNMINELWKYLYTK